MKKIITLLAFAFLLAGIISVRVIRVNAVSKNDTPPGQTDKTEKTNNSNKPETTTDKNKSVKPTAKPEVKPVKVQQFLDQKKKPDTATVSRLGTAKIKDLIRESTKSGDLTIGGTKYRIREMTMTMATTGATMRRRAISGVITGLGDGRIIISHQTQQERVNSIYYNANTVFKLKGQVAPTAADLKVGMRIAASGEIVDGSLLASRIHIIPGNAFGMFAKNPVASEGAGLDLTPTPATGSATPTPVATVSASPTATVAPTPTTEPPITSTPEPDA